MEKVAKVYRQEGQEVIALNGVNLTIARGEFVAIMGPSGSGKSTLLNLIGGLDQPTSGSVIVDGKLISSLSDDQMTHLRRSVIGIIFQFFNLLPHLTVWENVALPLLLRGESSQIVRTRVSTYLGEVGLLQRADHRPGELSGGEQQRTAIARALVIHPKILLADEPTGNLDSGIGREVMELIRSCSARQHISVILATHSDLAASFADRTILLKDGQIIH